MVRFIFGKRKKYKKPKGPRINGKSLSPKYSKLRNTITVYRKSDLEEVKAELRDREISGATVKTAKMKIGGGAYVPKYVIRIPKQKK